MYPNPGMFVVRAALLSSGSLGVLSEFSAMRVPSGSFEARPIVAVTVRGGERCATQNAISTLPGLSAKLRLDQEVRVLKGRTPAE